MNKNPKKEGTGEKPLARGHKIMPVITHHIDNELKTVLLTNVSNSFGNQTLYDMCKKGNILNSNELADEIWLIGRSYAASPERRFSKREGSLMRGRGTGDYFQHIADYLVKQSDFVNLVATIKLLSPLNFDCSKNDFKMLCLSIQVVEKFNELIIAASKNYDSTHNAGILVPPTTYKNQISFCSKFLHFQKPESFFIIDTYTFEASTQLFSQHCRGSVNLYSTLIDKNEMQLFCNKFHSTYVGAKLCTSRSAVMENYQAHVQRSYSLGVILKDIEKYFFITKSPNITYPRLTDIVFQHVL